jgi:hypothetical protein
LHLDDGTLLQGELQPAPIDGAALQVLTSAGLRSVPRAQVRAAAAGAAGARAQPVPGRRFAVDLPALQTLAATCTATHSAAHGGLWLDVQLSDGRCEAWHLPPRSLPLLRWLGQAAPARPPAPRNVGELWAALDRPPARRAQHLGQALVEAGLVTSAALTKALQQQAEADARGEPHR